MLAEKSFTAGHCKCRLDGADLVFYQGDIIESHPCPDYLRPFFDVVDEMFAVVNVNTLNNGTIETDLIPCPWINLHLHTEFSLLDGAIKVGELSKKLKGSEYSPCCAITDHGNMFGTYAFSKALKDSGEKPIIGCEVYCQGTNGLNENNHLILLCKNKVGYKNLCKILTEAEENFYFHANVTMDMLRKYSEGLVCLSACLAGELAQQLLAGNDDKAYEFIETMLDIFGSDFYIEIQDHNITDELRIRKALLSIADEFGIKVVATTDSHYLNKEDAEAHEILLCIGVKKTLDDPTHFKFDGDGYHVLSNKEAYELFKSVPQAIATQMEIAAKCEFFFEDTEVTMPEFEVPDGMTQREYFEKLCWDGFHERFDGTDVDVHAYEERLKYELEMMSHMGFEGYFLIVRDFIKWSLSNGIAVGPGRGSCVGSLAAYCLEITDLDPIPLELLFERFLNPERVSMPDIDVDIADDRRQEVIDYVQNKYGADHVSRIITFGTLAARACIRDVGRVLGVNVDAACKAVPAKPKMTIARAFEESADFKAIYDNNENVKKVVDIAKKLEGLSRHKSQHACGVIIAKDPISDTVPEVMLKDKQGIVAPTAAYNMSELESLGLLKVDFLGLRNMSIIKNSCDAIGVKEKNIDLYDVRVYEHISTGNTDGVFQIESPGMKSLMKDMFYDVPAKLKQYAGDKNKLKAFGHECFERMIAAISLYRPGPMDYIPDYIAGMRNPERIRYDCPELEPILAKTYGVLAYQEQVQQICRTLAGFSLARADIIRKAMGKKKQKVMDAEREVFLYGNANNKKPKEKLVPGCVANGIPENVAIIVWNKMAKFAEYAFNKSHAAGYSVITIRTAWLKLYYPVIFWNATLNSVLGKLKKIRKYISSTTKDAVKVLAPSVNRSSLVFTAEGNSVRMGLQALRNLGKSAIPIIEERANGEYSSLADLIKRVSPDKSSIESLAYSGALDEFGNSRKAVIVNMPKIIAYKEKLKKFDMWCDTQEINEWYDSFISLELDSLSEMDENAKLEEEYKYTGMYVTGHPLNQFEDLLSGFSHSDIEELVVDEPEIDDDEEMAVIEQERRVVVVGILKEVETKLTKKGDQMMVASLEDKTGSIKVTVFPRQYESAKMDFIENNTVIIEGLWKVDDFGSQIHVDKVSPMSNIEASSDAWLFVLVDEKDVESISQKLLNEYSGSGPRLCIRSMTENGHHSRVFDTKKSELVIGKFKDFKNKKDYARIKVNFPTFSAIKEMVKDITVRTM